MKKIVYHAFLFFIPIIVIYITGLIDSQNGTKIEVSVSIQICILGYFTVLHLISFFVMYQVCRKGEIMPYIIPALLFIPILFAYFEIKFTDNTPDIIYYWVCRPLFFSSLVYTTGFLVYKKWIDKSNLPR